MSLHDLARRSVPRTLFLAALAALAGCHVTADPPQRYVEVLYPGTLEDAQPVDVVVAPILNTAVDPSLPAEALRTAGAADRFYREVEAAAKLLHPNIVTASDAGQQGDTHYLVMELVDGQDLGSLLKERGPLPVETAVDCRSVYKEVVPAHFGVDAAGLAQVFPEAQELDVTLGLMG